MKTLLLVGPTPPPYNGCSVSMRNLLDSRLRDSYRIVHLDTADRRGLENSGRFDWTNVRLALVHFAGFLTRLFADRPDVVYVPVSQNALGFLRDALFLVPARLLRHPIVIHIHGGYFGRFYQESSPPLRALVRWIFRGVTQVVVLGEQLRGMVAGLVPPERVAVVPNGIRAETRPIPGRDPDSGAVRRVVYLGTLIESKGFLDVLEAATIVAPRHPEAKFLFAGSFYEPSDERKAQRYRSAEVDGHVEFLGVVTGAEKDRLLQEADIFVFPTFYPYEGHPLVVLEAMAAGLPIVTTDHGAIAETVADGENGFLVPQRDPAALAESVERLLGDEPLRQRLGRASRQRYLESYTLDHWVDRMSDVFAAASDASAADRSRKRSE